MHAPVLRMVPLAFLVLRVTAQVTLYKCCGENEMLAGDGSTCVSADWSHSVSHPLTVGGVIFRPLNEAWVRRWLPPGLPVKNVSQVCPPRRHHRILPYLKFCDTHMTDNTFGEVPVAVSVNESSLWDLNRTLEQDIRRSRVVFVGENDIARPKRGGGQRRARKYCVDAAQPPLGPFVLRLVPVCRYDDCIIKCCDRGQVLVNKGGDWQCQNDSRGFWSPLNSSFVDPDAPSFHEPGIPSPHSRRLVDSEANLARFVRRQVSDFFFSTWRTCVDYQRNANDSLDEVVLYRVYSRITKAIYWLLRPLCCVSSMLLAVALLSLGCNGRMRWKVHGWNLACHAVCLFTFNVWQVVYYMTIIDEIDESAYVPRKWRGTCKHFAFVLYFLLMAAHAWLTAICVNMALGFSKLQVVRPASERDRKRFLALSSFAWTFPILMTSLCAYATYTAPSEQERLKTPVWYRPTFVETRVCFNEIEHFVYKGRTRHFSKKSGTAIFYYGPVTALGCVNIICIVYTLRKMDFLRRGNSILRREEDQCAFEPAAEESNLWTANTTTGDGRKFQARTGSGTGRAADAKAIKLYLKMLLMTGCLEIVAEMISWTTSNYKEDSFFNILDHTYAYRATGYVADCFRAACVAWLAAPEGGYWTAVRKWLSKERGGRGRSKRKHNTA